MSAVDARTAQTQAQATDPAGSAWVSANAGSGKTFVLSRRVIRLLLSGVDPARILCLTFTKAAASEMANRVFAELSRWTTLPAAALSQEIADIEGTAPSPAMLAAARRLFARALDTPGGLKIQTIHAFCERLLHQFPFEANVAGHFEVLDERDERALAVDARRAVLAKAADEPDGVLGRALKTVLNRVSDRTHEDSIAEFVDKRDQIGAWVIANRDLDGAIADLKDVLQLAAGETSEARRAEVTAGAPFSSAEAARLVDLLARGGTNDVSASERLRPFATSDDPAVQVDAYLAFFMKENGDFRSEGSLVNKKTRALMPGLDEKLTAECARLPALVDRIRTAELFESSVAMLRIADAAMNEYARLKRARGVLDFEDLVVRTVALLARSDASAWVHYKLDRGLDHILVDEAQDTSPRQWQVIQRLAQEFFAGEGASSALRTLFAVGDEKQSIYSFQGAVPAWFARTQREVGTAARAASYLWADLELHLSFRSAPVILDAVDAVFAAPAVHAGLTAEPRPPLHQAIRRNDPGRVVLWPAITPPDKAETDDWIKPVDYLGQDSPEVTLARRIALTVRGWLDSGETLDAPGKDGKPQPIRPGGILVLVRSRGALTDAIIRELKVKGVPIAGADRLTLTEHIAVMDLMALGRVVLLPEDDLSLAALLKSPLVGLDEDALYTLAHGRGGSLWAALERRAAESDSFARARVLIEGWRAEADWRDPHAFFARILGPGGGRVAILRRLGPEAEDVIDEFLAQALAFERTNIPSLEGFLAWLIDGEAEIKRDTDVLRDEVRVMTVHGAKGLEADVVFLVDNGTAPHAPGAHDPKLLSLGDDDDPDNPGPFVWMRKVKQMPLAVGAILAAWRVRAEEEYRRLLYVGMTRARDRLYVTGIVKQTRKIDPRWHALVSGALRDGLTEIVSADGTPAHEWRATARAGAVVPPVASVETGMVLPDWARRAAPRAAAPLPRITPSTAVGEDASDDVDRPRLTFMAVARPSALRARERGRLVHRLLQSLPDIAPERRQDTGARFLEAATAGNQWNDADRAALLAEAMAILSDSVFADAFAPGSRAEVDIAGRFETAKGEALVSGRIDRLAVTAGGVLIVDYKTNRQAPAEPADVQGTYVAQLALYRALLRRLYPGKNVAAALVWTERPTLMRIPDDMLNLAESAMARG